MKEISPNNAKVLETIDSAIFTITLSDCSPSTVSEALLFASGSELHSKWADKSWSMVVFRNKKVCSSAEVCASDN